MQNDFTIRHPLGTELGFEKFPSDRFGKPACPYQPPEFTIGKIAGEPLEKAKEQAWRGAVISDVTQAIMSAIASSGTDGVYFKMVP